MAPPKALNVILTLVHALAGWAVCGAIIGIGRSLTTVEITLWIHAILVPVVFGLISTLYFYQFNFTRPLATAFIFLAVVMFMDFFVVAPFIEKSFRMFGSFLGTWLPFSLIFLSTYTTGKIIASQKSKGR